MIIKSLYLSRQIAMERLYQILKGNQQLTGKINMEILLILMEILQLCMLIMMGQRYWIYMESLFYRKQILKEILLIPNNLHISIRILYLKRKMKPHYQRQKIMDKCIWRILKYVLKKVLKIITKTKIFEIENHLQIYRITNIFYKNNELKQYLLFLKIKIFKEIRN